MTSILQRPPHLPLPVETDFFFKQDGPPFTITIDGDSFPYPPLPSDEGSDYRYAMGTTPTRITVVFDAINQIGEEEAKVNPHVVTPPGVEILAYHWDFGDGATGEGPVISHIYEVADPATAIKLTVEDSRGFTYAVAKPLSLVNTSFGYVGPLTIRGRNTETPTRDERSAHDEAVSEDVATFFWTKRGGVKVRDVKDSAVSKDVARAMLHLVRSGADAAVANDVALRNTRAIRPVTDVCLTSDIATANIIVYRSATDKALSKDKPSSNEFIKRLRATVSFAGSVTPKLH